MTSLVENRETQKNEDFFSKTLNLLVLIFDLVEGDLEGSKIEVEFQSKFSISPFCLI